jgi:hypothetical protein
MIHSVQITACAIGILAILATAEMTMAQQSQEPIVSASGWNYLSQFANPASGDRCI